MRWKMAFNDYGIKAFTYHWQLQSSARPSCVFEVIQVRSVISGRPPGRIKHRLQAIGKDCSFVEMFEDSTEFVVGERGNKE